MRTRLSSWSACEVYKEAAAGVERWPWCIRMLVRVVDHHPGPASLEVTGKGAYAS